MMFNCKGYLEAMHSIWKQISTLFGSIIFLHYLKNALAQNMKVIELCYLKKLTKHMYSKIRKSSVLLIVYTQKRLSRYQLGHRINRRSSEYVAAEQTMQKDF